MATTYVVVRAITRGEDETYTLVARVEATNAEKARRIVAEEEIPGNDLEAGVTLIAVPARNWDSGRGTLKAETTRRIRSA